MTVKHFWDWFVFRWVCKHYGHHAASKRKLKTNKRPHQAILPCGCEMYIHVTYNKLRQHYVVKKLHLEHNHPHGPAEYDLYSTSRRPTGELREQIEVLVEHGANPMMVTQYAANQGKQMRPRDVYNIKQKLLFRG